MFNGWFCLGGTEIVNNPRAEDYTRTSPCGANWFRGPYCSGLRNALMTPDDFLSPGDSRFLPQGGYEYTNLQDEAPWFDPMVPNFAATEFLGVYCISVDGLDDDTTEAVATERITGGGVIGAQRDRAKVMRFRVILTALTERGLEYGRTWLANMLRESTCSVHENGSCGTASLTFFTMCPPRYVQDGGGAGAYWSSIDQERRILHGVKCTTGLLKEQEFERVITPQPIQPTLDEDGNATGNSASPNHGLYGGIYEFTLTAEQPRMLGIPRLLPESMATGQYLIEDAPLNLVPTPSAELPSGSIEVARNYSTNPSVETDSIGWATQSATVSGASAAPYVSGIRDNAHDSVGSWSWRVRILGNGSTVATGRTQLAGVQDVAIGAAPAGSRFSFSMWGFVQVTAGAGISVIHAMDARIEWRDGASALLRTDTIERITSNYGGHTFSKPSIVPPAGAVTARCMVRADVTWGSSTVPTNNSDIMLWVDALALTVP